MKKTLLTLAAGLVMAATANAQSSFTYWLNGVPTKVESADSITFGELAPTLPPTPKTLTKKGLVITEMFFGSYPKRKSGSGVNYKYDQYIKIGNNSDEVKYLDGVILAETLPDNNLKWYNFYNNPEPTAAIDTTAIDSSKNIIVQAVYRFPGDGQTYAIAPGEEKIIALCARNHKAEHGLFGQDAMVVGTYAKDSIYKHNADSLLIDLSKADFEIYDAPAADVDPDETQDVDNLDVLNMEKWYNSSQTLWVLNQHGNLSYVLAEPDDSVNKENYLKDHYTEFYYHYDLYGWDGTITETNQRSSLQKAYTMPKEWVLDCLNMAGQEEARGLYLTEDLDSGYAAVNYNGLKVDRNVEKSVVRKQENGKWNDTNNSTNDFESFAKPTLR